MRTLLSSALLLFAVTGVAYAQAGAGEDRPFLDLDGDGTTDLTIERTPAQGVTYFDDGERVSRAGHRVLITPKRSNEIAASSHSFLALFEKGELIRKTFVDSLRWSTNEHKLYRKTSFVSRDSTSTTWKGYKPNEGKKYLGVRLVTRKGTHYGWVHVHVDPSSEKVSIRASDYNPKAGQPIRAGRDR